MCVKLLIRHDELIFNSQCEHVGTEKKGYHNLGLITGHSAPCWTPHQRYEPRVNRQKSQNPLNTGLTTPARPDSKTTLHTQPWAGRRAL